MGQGPARVAAGWLSSATDRRQCLEGVGRTGQVARRSGLRKEGHNMGIGGHEGRNGRQLVHCGKCLYIGETGYKQNKERRSRSAGVVLRS
jgi:hypothetical protein